MRKNQRRVSKPSLASRAWCPGSWFSANGAELRGQVVGLVHRPFRRAPDVLVEQRPAEPAAADRRMDEPGAVIDGHPVADDPLHLGESDDAVIELDDHDVVDRIEARVALEVARGRAPGSGSTVGHRADWPRR